MGLLSTSISIHREHSLLHNSALTDVDGDVTTASNIINVSVPIVSLSANTTSIIAVQAVDFTPTVQSGNIPLTWTWNFGDGTPSATTQGPVTHMFTSATNSPYDVQLTVVDPYGDVVSASITITVVPDLMPVVVLVANITTIIAGNAIDFVPTVTHGNAPLTWTWDFGDGSATVTTQGPVSHIFTNATGSPFVVHLTVTDANGDAVTTSVVITVNSATPSNWWSDFGGLVTIFATATAGIAIVVILGVRRIKGTQTNRSLGP